MPSQRRQSQTGSQAGLPQRTLVVAAGQAVSVAAGLVTTKTIASWVDAESYGQASLILGVVSLVNGLLLGPLMVVHLRLYFDYLTRGMARWYASVFRRFFALAAAVSILAYLLVAAAYRIGGSALYLDHLFSVGVLLVSQPHLSGLTNYLEAHRRQRALAALNVVQRLLQPIFLVALLNTTVPSSDAVLLAQAAAILAVLVAFPVPSDQHTNSTATGIGSAEVGILKQSIRAFGWELPVSYALMWVVTTSDRYLVQHFMTVRDVGMYAINYGLWSMPFMMLNGILELLTRSDIYEHAARGHWESVKRALIWRTTIAMLLCLAGTAVLVVFAERIGVLLLGAGYWIDPSFVITIALAHTLCVLGYSIVPLFLAAKQPSPIMWATLCAALCGILANWFLIPLHGLGGAAVATLSAYLLWAAVMWLGGVRLVLRLTKQHMPGTHA